MILVYSDLEGLDFRSSVGGVNQQRYNSRANRYEILVSPQRQILFVAAKGFIEQRIALINPSPKAVFYYLVEEKRGQDSTMVFFTVEPTDAVLFVDSVEVEVNKTVKIPIGDRNIEIMAEGYKTFSDIVNITKEEVKYDFTLRKLELVSVKLKTNVGGALVEIDGKVVGESDEKGHFSWVLYPGIHSLKLRKSGYLRKAVDITVNEEGNNVFELELTKNAGYVEFVISPSDAVITLNKKRLDDLKQAELVPGKYQLTISRIGFYDYNESFEISINQNKRIEVSLVPQMGELEFTPDPSNASVVLRNVDGKAVQQWKGAITLKDVQVGRYELVVSAQGYRTQRKRVDVKENKKTEVKVVLEEPLSFQKLFVAKKYEPTSFLHLTYLPHLQDGQVSLMNSNYGINYSFTFKQWGGYVEYGRSLNFESSSLEYSEGTVTGSQLFPEGLTGTFVPGTNISSYEIGAGILYRFGIFTASLGVSYYDYQFRQFADFDSQEIENNLMINIPTNGFTGVIPKAGLRVLLKNFSLGYSVATYHPQSIGNMLMLGFAF